MTLAWGLPLAFAGLAALLVPLLLHLDRRRSVQRLRFAALRWIAAQARPRRTWRLTEWMLLTLRLALIAVLVAWLAQPWLRDWPRAPVQWILVAPGAAEIPAGAAAEHAVWLAPGFPSVKTVPPARDGASVSSLLREFDARIARDDSLEVRVPTLLDGLDDTAIELSREVRWVVAGDAPPRSTAAPAKRRLALRYAAEDEPALRYVRAALRAWQGVPELAVEIDEGAIDRPVPADVDAVLRLRASTAVGQAESAHEEASQATATQAATTHAAPPHAAPTNSAATHAAATHATTVTEVEGGRARRVLNLDPAALGPALLQSAEFPRWLHRAVFGDPPAPDRALASQVAATATATPLEPPAVSLRPWLAWLAAALFLLERVLANGRRLASPA